MTSVSSGKCPRRVESDRETNSKEVLGGQDASATVTTSRVTRSASAVERLRELVST